MKSALVGYILLFLGIWGVDQTSKWHSEKTYLAHWDPNVSEVYRADHDRVWSAGVSPFQKDERSAQGGNEAKAAALGVTNNWVDFNTTYLRNHGAVWGVFSSMPDIYRLTLFFSVTVIAVMGALWLFRSTPVTNKIYRTALVFILAGAIGNFTDRVMLTYVIDWIHFHWKIFGWEYSFPVFNVADISIDMGLGLVIVDLVRTEWRMRKSKGASIEPTIAPI
jgi:signal peptidase II